MVQFCLLAAAAAVVSAAGVALLSIGLRLLLLAFRIHCRGGGS